MSSSPARPAPSPMRSRSPSCDRYGSSGGDGVVRIEFDRRGLLPLGVLGVGFTGVGAIMVFSEYVLLGLVVPTPPRAIIAVATFLMGSWLCWCAVVRARSSDPAIGIDGARVELHVNPGWRLTLTPAEVLAVGPVVPAVTGLGRWVQGPERFEIRTTRRERWRSANVSVCSRYVEGDLSVVREQVAAALAPAPHA